MVKYDPSVLQKYAERMYARANGIVMNWTLLLGFLFGGTAATVAYNNSIPGSNGWLIAGGAAFTIGAVVGYAFGNSRALMLRLAAQTALCQREIEMNTRKAS